LNPNVVARVIRRSSTAASSIKRRAVDYYASDLDEIPSVTYRVGTGACPSRALTLVGHWRSTTILFDQPQDEHLVLRPDGTAETWVVTADSKPPVTRGRWRAQGTTLGVDWQDGRQWGQPYTFYQGQLVFPNVPNRRQFWELIE
jgi:hypothetical protein